MINIINHLNKLRGSHLFPNQMCSNQRSCKNENSTEVVWDEKDELHNLAGQGHELL